MSDRATSNSRRIQKQTSIKINKYKMEKWNAALKSSLRNELDIKFTSIMKRIERIEQVLSISSDRNPIVRLGNITATFREIEERILRNMRESGFVVMVDCTTGVRKVSCFK